MMGELNGAMKELWRSLHTFGHGTCLGFDHSVEDQVTNKMVMEVFNHASAYHSMAHLKEYNVLEVGSSPSPTLSLTLALMRKHMNPKLESMIPPFHVTALDVTPPHSDVELLRQEGVHYIVGDAHDLPFKKPQFHAAMMSTVLEYLENPQKALKNVHDALHPGGLLVMLLHAPGSNTSSFMRETAEQEKKAFTAMNAFHEGKMSAREVIGHLKEGRLHNMFGFDSPHAMLQDYLDHPERVEVVRGMLAEKVFDKHKQLADQIDKGSFKNSQQLVDTLGKAGFDLSNLQELSGWSGGQKFWVASAHRFD